MWVCLAMKSMEVFLWHAQDYVSGCKQYWSEGRLFKGGVAKTQRKSRNLSMSIEAKLKDRQTKQFIDYMS